MFGNMALYILVVFGPDGEFRQFRRVQSPSILKHTLF